MKNKFALILFITTCTTLFLILFINNLQPIPAQSATNTTTSLFDASYAITTTAGTTLTYTHQFLNDTPNPHTYALTAATLPAWTTAVTPTTITLNNGQSAIITATVTIPPNALPGILALTTITATTDGLAPSNVYNTALIDNHTPLAIPPLQTGRMIDGQRVYTLTHHNDITQFWPGIDTPTAGYNDNSYLGPTLIMTRGEIISAHITNNLDQVTTNHWHGFHVPFEMDGGPHQGILPGQTWRPTFEMRNETATMWYHPHPHPHIIGDPATGEQVYSGLSGMILIKDDNPNAANLPQTYGVDQFPLIVQDRNFNPDGTFDYRLDNQNNLRKGDHFLINGTLAGNLDVPAQLVRFHILNAANARFYQFGFSDNRTFQLIASDGGLLNEPVPQSRIWLGPGERVEIVVDFSGETDNSLHFMAYNSEIGDALLPGHIADQYDRANIILATFHVTPQTPNPILSLPLTLNNIPRLNAQLAVHTRTFFLQSPPAINGDTFDMDTINIATELGTIEVWSFINISDQPHPMHIHDDQFQILSRNGNPPAPHEMGWKDTVTVNRGERVNIIKGFYDFSNPNGPYMYHCHILEHEDAGMMGQYTVLETSQIYLPSVLR